MAIKKRKNSEIMGNETKKKKKHEANWLLRFTILVFIVPILILVYVLFTSMESSTEPVVGDRFDNQLDPKITNEQIDQIKNSLTYSEAENVSVDCISATLRITIDCQDACTQEQVAAITNDAYAKVNAVLPIDKYFTNTKKIKMYDLEISVYNFIPKDGQPSEGRVYYSMQKSGAAKQPTTDVISTPKNQEVNDAITNSQKGQ